MALQIDDIPDPTGTAPIPAAYCKVALIALDVLTGAGRVEVATFRDAAAAAAGKAPVDRFGQPLGASFPTLADYLADPQFLAAYNLIRTRLYADLKALPRFVNASDV